MDSSLLVDVDLTTKELILPPWASKVRAVYPREGDGSAASIAEPLSHIGGGQARTTAWRSWGDNRIRLHHWTGSSGLRLIVAKTPAPMIQFTVAEAPPADNKVVIPGSLTAGRFATQADWYKNERFECVSTNSALTSHAVTGVQRYCAASTPNILYGATLRTELTFSADWPDRIDVGDKFESVVPLPEELTRLAVLETAMICFQHHGNSEAQMALIDELRMERKDFQEYVQQRQVQGPDFYVYDCDGPDYDNQNKDTGYRW